MFDEMRGRGVRVIEFHPVSPWRTRFRWSWVTWNRRNHRKLLVVDGRLGITGGLNLCDASAPIESGGEGWRDAMVEIEGPLAHQLGHLFERIWRRSGGAPLRDPPVPPGAPAGTKDAVRGARVVWSGWTGRRRTIRANYLWRISTARRTIHLTNAYFVPDRTVVRELRRAAARAVDVRILVPATSDVPLVRHASRALYDRLVRAGVHVHEYAGSVLHAKTAVIDGDWSTIGSYNLDYRSWKLNLELNAVISDPDFGAKMEERFAADLARAPEVDLRAFRMRPLSDRLVERFAHAVRRWL
jgi:cardiolipin synthase